MSFKARYPGNCRVCGHRYEKGVSVDQDAMGIFHAAACEPANYEPRGTVRRPGDGGKRPTNSPGGTLYGPRSGPEV